MSSLGKTILKNTTWLFGAEALNMILTLIGGILIARSLGTIGYGQYGFALSFAALFMVVADMGLTLLFINKASQEKDKIKKYFDNLFTLKILLGLFTLLLIITTIQFTGKTEELKLIVYIIALNTVLSTLTSFLHAIFRIHEKMEYEALLKTLQNVLFFLMVLYIVFTGKSLLALVVGGSIVIFIGFLISLIFIGKKYSFPRLAFNWPFLKNILKQTLPLAVSIIFLNICFSLDSVMLSLWKDDEAVGLYTAAYKFIIILLTFSNLYYGAIFPVISRLYKESKEKMGLLLEVTVKIALTLSIPLGVGTYFYASEIINLIYGAEYIKAAVPLTILIWSAILIIVGMAYAHSLIACGRRLKHTIGVGIGALLNIILNFIVIPKYGIIGAAWTTLISEIVIFIYMYLQFYQIYNIKFYKHLLKPLVATTVMTLSILYLTPNLYFIYAVLIAIVIYFACFFIIGGLSKHEFKVLKELVVLKKHG